MGVRVRIQIKTKEASIATSALVNSGFESCMPEIILPPKLAEILGLRGSSVAVYHVAGGGATSGIRVDERLHVKLILSDRKTEEIEVIGTILPGEDEVLISDKLASELGIVIIDPYRGSWCLRDELGKKIREPAETQVWK